jgi:heme exporter protein D
MQQLVTLAQALGVAYASGISVYATVALLGLAQRVEWIAPLPGSLSAVGNIWVIAIAGALYVIELLATLIPGVASAWETFHSLIRPPAAAALAVLTAWQGDPLVTVIAGLLGGTLAAGTHATKLGLRYAIDTSPEPVTNGMANAAELGVVASVAFFVWSHPFVTLTLALVLLVALVLAVRAIWRGIRRILARPFSSRPERAGGGGAPPPH